MPREVEIEIFNIARTMTEDHEVTRWLKHIGADADAFMTSIPDEMSDPAFLVALAAKRCYMSFEPGLNPNVTKVRSDMVAYFDNILSSKHGSVLEHACYTFAIEGVSRVFTAEMNRHRAGWAVSEGSLRFIRFDEEIPFWMPTSFRDHPDDDPDLAERKRLSRKLFHTAFKNQENIYKSLLDVWTMSEAHHNFAYKKKVTSALRRIVGMGVATGGVWTGNLRALRHVIAMRTSPAAEEEILHVFGRVAEFMRQSEPLVFGDFVEDGNGHWDAKFGRV